MEDFTVWNKITELGIGIFAVGVISYILYVFIKSHKDELNSSRIEREKNQEWFMQYVNENNHQKAEMIKEHTEAVVQTKESIKQHTEAIKALTEAIINRK